MDEYQISVSLNGQFMFRTDWDDVKSRVGANAVALASSMPLARVRVVKRSKLRTEVPTGDLL